MNNLTYETNGFIMVLITLNGGIPSMTISKKNFAIIASLALTVLLCILCILLLIHEPLPESPDDHTVDQVEVSTDSPSQQAGTEPQIGINYPLTINGQQWDINTTEMILTDVDIDELIKNLPWLPNVKSISLNGALPMADSLNTLADTYPGIEFYWQIELCGIQVDINTTELVLTNIDANKLDQNLSYLPNLKRVSLDGALPASEALLKLVNAYPHISFYWQIKMFNIQADIDTTELEVTNADPKDLAVFLSYLPNVEKVILKGTLPDADALHSLIAEFPAIDFNWDITILGVAADSSTTELELKNVNVQELKKLLPYVPKVEKVTLTGNLPNAEELQSLTKSFKQIVFYWQIEIHGIKADVNTTDLDLSTVTLTSLNDVINAIGYLPKLKTLNITGYHNYAQIDALLQKYNTLQIIYTVNINGRDYPLDTKTLTLTNADIQELTQRLPHLTKLTSVSLTGTLPKAQALLALTESYPNITFSWQFAVHGIQVTNNTTSLNLSNVALTNLTEVEQALGYLPKLKTLNVTGYNDYAKIQSLNTTYSDLQIIYTVCINGKNWALDTTSMVLTNADIQELMNNLPYLPQIQNVSLVGILPAASSLKALTNKFPIISFYWQIEVLGIQADINTTKLDFSNIPMETVAEVEAALGYLPGLKKVTMIDCGISDSEMEALSQRHPSIRFVWYLEPGPTHVEISGVDWPIDTEVMTVCNANLDELNENLPYLTQLTYVALEGTLPDSAGLKVLVSNFPYIAFYWQVSIAGVQADVNTTTLKLSNVTAQELTQNLPYLPKLVSVSLEGNLPDSATLRFLYTTYPGISFYWHIEVYGIRADVNTTTLDLSNIPMENVSVVENAVDYLPSLKKVIMCNCRISNKDMDALSKRNPSVRFVWTVSLGPHFSIRTDATSFISPSGSIWLTDEDAYNLRYCVDMVCLDLGHHYISNCDFVRYMPNLRYLIIADCSITDLSPLSNHTALVYLEAFLNPITDYSPLLTCTNLQDLNLCFTYGDIAPLTKMPWLKRLWWSPYRDEKNQLWDILPDTEINITTAGSTADGWRTGPLYYEMRDYLGMGYMTG